jgi:GNAT superfamily N-acetyltransferase
VRRWLRSRVAGYRALTGAAGPRDELVLADGAVRAFRVPALAHLSVFNGVLPEDAAALPGVLGELEARYGDSSWLVWLAPWQLEHAAALEARGLALDEPAELMAAWIDGLDLEPRAPLQVTEHADAAEFAAVADAAFELPEGLTFAPAFAGDLPADLELWVAHADGRPAACAAAVACEGDVWFALVGTTPEHRRRGLSSELMRTVLRRARDAGATSTSLEATLAGRAVYARLGLRGLGAMQLWERAARP